MVYVITGGPGFGKTTVIGCLQEMGYPVCPENARELLSSGRDKPATGGGSDLPADFERVIAGGRMRFLEATDKEQVAFADRGLPDQVAYSWYKNKIPSAFIEAAVRSGMYANPVFVTPPWEEIYSTDAVRRENFAEASAIHDLIVKAYRAYGYETVELPLADPDTRCRFILGYLGIPSFHRTAEK